jgi:hypothetical protein
MELVAVVKDILSIFEGLGIKIRGKTKHLSGTEAEAPTATIVSRAIQDLQSKGYSIQDMNKVSDRYLASYWLDIVINQKLWALNHVSENRDVMNTLSYVVLNKPSNSFELASKAFVGYLLVNFDKEHIAENWNNFGTTYYTNAINSYFDKAIKEGVIIGKLPEIVEKMETTSMNKTLLFAAIPIFFLAKKLFGK